MLDLDLGPDTVTHRPRSLKAKCQWRELTTDRGISFEKAKERYDKAIEDGRDAFWYKARRPQVGMRNAQVREKEEERERERDEDDVPMVFNFGDSHSHWKMTNKSIHTDT